LYFIFKLIKNQNSQRFAVLFKYYRRKIGIQINVAILQRSLISNNKKLLFRKILSNSNKEILFNRDATANNPTSIITPLRDL
jgi:hypothetical protein